MKEFNRIYHHKRWTGRHEMVLIRPEKVIVNTQQGPQVMDKPGFSAIFNRGTYQCKDPRIATLIEKSREFLNKVIIVLPDPEVAKNVHNPAELDMATGNQPQPINQPVQQLQPVVPKQVEAPQPVVQGQSDLDRLIQAANVLSNAINKAIEARIPEKGITPPVQLLEPENSPLVAMTQQDAVPEQPQVPTGVVTVPEPTGVDGEVPFIKREPTHVGEGSARQNVVAEVPRATDKEWQGTPQPLNATRVAEDGRFVNVQGEENFLPPGGDGLMRPTQVQMLRVGNTGMPDADEIVRAGGSPGAELDLNERALLSGEAHAIPVQPPAGLQNLIPEEVPNEIPVIAPKQTRLVPGQAAGPGIPNSETVPRPGVGPVPQINPEEAITYIAETAPKHPALEAEAVIHEARELAQNVKDQVPVTKPKIGTDGKRLLYCKICKAGPFTGGRSVAKHRQEAHPEIYAARKKK